MLVAAQLPDLSALRNCTAPADQVASSAVRKVSSPGRRSHRARTSRAAQVNARRRRLMRADNSTSGAAGIAQRRRMRYTCLLYTSDAADDLLCVDLGGRRIIKKK